MMSLKTRKACSFALGVTASWLINAIAVTVRPTSNTGNAIRTGLNPSVIAAFNSLSWVKRVRPISTANNSAIGNPFESASGSLKAMYCKTNSTFAPLAMISPALSNKAPSSNSTTTITMPPARFGTISEIK